MFSTGSNTVDDGASNAGPHLAGAVLGEAALPSRTFLAWTAEDAERLGSWDCEDGDFGGIAALGTSGWGLEARDCSFSRVELERALSHGHDVAF
jgi:hypothetical protein